MPETQSRVDFAASVRDPNHPKRPILLGSFKPGLDVILINEKETCKVNNGSAFSFEYVYGPDDLVKATNFIGMENCSKRFTIALVGASSESVQLHSAKLVQSPLHKDAELRAYRLVEPVTPAPEDPMVLLVLIHWRLRSDALRYSSSNARAKGKRPPSYCTSRISFFNLKGIVRTGTPSFQ